MPRNDFLMHDLCHSVGWQSGAGVHKFWFSYADSRVTSVTWTQVQYCSTSSSGKDASPPSVNGTTEKAQAAQPAGKTTGNVFKDGSFLMLYCLFLCLQGFFNFYRFQSYIQFVSLSFPRIVNDDICFSSLWLFLFSLFCF